MNALARSVVEVVALTGAQGTVLALLAFALTRAGRLRPGWQAAVWLVVLLKFVLPWGPAMPWSLADLIAALRDHHAASEPVVVGRGVLAPPPPPVSAVWSVVAALWAAGALYVLGRSLIAQHRVMAAARRAPRAPEHARHVLAALTRTPPELVIGADDVGPHVVGVIRPIIVIPSALLADRLLLRAALLHELAHIRRRDALARIAQLVAGAVFFCWPVVRIVNRRLDLAREAACDAWALEAGNLPRPSYARLLVRMTQLRTAAAPSLAAPHSLDARVAAVLGPPAHARLGAAHWIGLAAWAVLALGGARTAAARGQHVACKYTPQLAEALRAAHPEADRDGDGVLSRDEACEFQAELRRWAGTPENAEQVSRLDVIDESLLTQPLCCNCSVGAEHSAPWISEKRSDACQSEGVSHE
ncbi:MAG TPA: M56 family metallopeptidase [Kofleriaceae bacterium]|nr:M56 family metallopeptidase [Kofleriaceae bacterium]